MTGPVPIGPGQLALGASLLIAHGLLSLGLQLGLERKLLIAGVRTVVQLLLMGWLLVPVFASGSAALVLGVCTVMIVLAARESVGRVSRRYRGIQVAATVALFVAGGSTALLASGVILAVDPWWSPQYLIPMLGMILGNALTGISLGLDRALAELDEGRGRVEALLALGATRWEASRPVAAEALRTGLVPILNAMSAVGLVTIPGMMTGQILGGTEPSLAARYQILILFLIAFATALGTGLSVLFALLAVFDDQHRLRGERISTRGS
ncbi:MAG: iron export ABC transporter permease subunit FetB [Myxococcales bacterium]|nr:iron export ABC transporter permease subunit FetB [Myxococcales bacterium]MCB9671485.1 iron export ABC transporter permease subunit FetB [Alphaproteobacteria bacterium]